jgi:hypothetical protein
VPGAALLPIAIFILRCDKGQVAGVPCGCL